MSEDWGGFNSGDEQSFSNTSPSLLKQPEQSAIIDMTNAEDSSGPSSFEVVGDRMYSEKKSGDAEKPEDVDLMTGLGGNLGKVVADQVWQSGQQQARQMISVYANIDVLRPYFDIELKTLLSRLAYSFVPVRSLSQRQNIPRELYGPLMTVFTLIAILLLNMKNAGTVLQQGTLMGTAFGICFGYWVGVSGLMYFLSYISNTHISIVQCLSLLGYGMVSHCVILLLGHFTHYSHGFFYLLWAIVAGASAARMVTVLLSLTDGKSQRMILCLSIASFHMLFLLYLHFAYHKVVEDLIGTLDETAALQHQPAARLNAPPADVQHAEPV